MSAEKKREQKAKLIQQLAHFLTDNVGGKSILLQMERSRSETDPRPCLAAEWAALLQAAGLKGYCDHAEAVKQLTEILK